MAKRTLLDRATDDAAYGAVLDDFQSGEFGSVRPPANPPSRAGTSPLGAAVGGATVPLAQGVARNRKIAKLTKDVDKLRRLASVEQQLPIRASGQAARKAKSLKALQGAKTTEAAARAGKSVLGLTGTALKRAAGGAIATQGVENLISLGLDSLHRLAGEKKTLPPGAGVVGRDPGVSPEDLTLASAWNKGDGVLDSISNVMGATGAHFKGAVDYIFGGGQEGIDENYAVNPKTGEISYYGGGFESEEDREARGKKVAIRNLQRAADKDPALGFVVQQKMLENAGLDKTHSANPFFFAGEDVPTIEDHMAKKKAAEQQERQAVQLGPLTDEDFSPLEDIPESQVAPPGGEAAAAQGVTPGGQEDPDDGDLSTTGRFATFADAAQSDEPDFYKPKSDEELTAGLDDKVFGGSAPIPGLDKLGKLAPSAAQRTDIMQKLQDRMAKGVASPQEAAALAREKARDQLSSSDRLKLFRLRLGTSGGTVQAKSAQKVKDNLDRIAARAAQKRDIDMWDQRRLQRDRNNLMLQNRLGMERDKLTARGRRDVAQVAGQESRATAALNQQAMAERDARSEKGASKRAENELQFRYDKLNSDKETAARQRRHEQLLLRDRTKAADRLNLRDISMEAQKIKAAAERSGKNAQQELLGYAIDILKAKAGSEDIAMQEEGRKMARNLEQRLGIKIKY